MKAENMAHRLRTRTLATLGTGLLLVAVLLPASPGEAAGLLIADGGFGGVLEIEEHSVQVSFNNGIVVTEVTQVFVNTEARQVEALYTFPVPEGASVANFSMWINGKEMVGEVVEKQRAREIYNSYKRVRRDPGLLEQTDYKTFEMRIFPIAANARQRVQIAYYQELDFDNDRATYVYPLATVTRRDIDSRTRGRFALTLDMKSQIPIVEVDSPSHGNDFVMAKHAENYWQASLETDGGDLSRDVVLAFKMARPRTGLDLVTSRGPGEDGFFALSFTAGEELKAEVDGMDYVFVLDVSGSMDRDGKLRLSRSSIGAFIDALGEGDRFEVMSFNVTPETLFGRLEPAEQRARSEALDFLESRRARGGTVLQPALQLAYRYHSPDRPLNVVILSDGMTEPEEQSVLLQMISTRPAGTRVFCIGVGNEVNRPLLSQLAEEAGGLAAFVSRGDNFQRQAQAFRRKLQRPAASNVQIDVEGVGAAEVEPGDIPNLFHGSPLRLYGRYSSPGLAKIHIRADIGGELLDEWVELDFPETDTANPEIERMWAWHRIQQLLREADRSNARASVIDEIVRLGEAFSIVTEYTSFLVLENDGEYKRWKIDRRNALRIARDRAEQQRLRSELERLRQQSTSALGPQSEDEIDAAKQASSSQSPNTTRQAPRPANVNAQRQNVDVGRNRGGGGGAIDPLAALMAVLIAGAAFFVYRFRV